MLLKRPRRNRRTPAIRSLLQETLLLPSDLVSPFFIIEGADQRVPITTLPGIDRITIGHLVKEAEDLHKKGIQAIALFPCIETAKKDSEGSHALKTSGILPQAIKVLKKEIPSLCVIVDIALDPFTSHGHDGVVSKQGEILNDATVEILAQQAIVYAEAGADIVAPSDMMDGRVKAIRLKLDEYDFHNVGILAYTAKYASSLYAPFREALGSKLQFGDKKTYQMNPANVREALLEAALDQEEGADMLMVKPALFYLDVIAKMHDATHLPICAYHVTGEYAMVMAAHEKGFVDAPKVFLEALISIKRAGADFIFTYAVPHILNQLAQP